MRVLFGSLRASACSECTNVQGTGWNCPCRINVFIQTQMDMKTSNKLTQKCRLLSRSAALAVGLVGTTFAFAQSSQSPFYVGGSLGAGFTDGNYSSQVQSAGQPSSGYTFNSAKRASGSEFAGRIYAGYRINPMFALELGYTDFGSHDVAYTLNKTAQFVPPNSPYVVNGRNKLDGITLDVVGTLPINSLLSVNGRAGVMSTNLRYSENISNPVGTGGVFNTELTTFSAPKERQTRFHWGVGTSYQLNPKLALTLDYQRVQGVGNTFAWTDSGNGKLNYNLISAGARFSF